MFLKITQFSSQQQNVNKNGRALCGQIFELPRSFATISQTQKRKVKSKFNFVKRSSDPTVN